MVTFEVENNNHEIIPLKGKTLPNLLENLTSTIVDVLKLLNI